MKTRNTINYLLTLVIFMLLPSPLFAYETYMGTINIEVGQTWQVFAEKYLTATGNWSKTGNCFYISSKSQTSCTIRGTQEGTAELRWVGIIEATEYNMYWTVNVSAKPVKVTSISISGNSSNPLSVGSTRQLTATVMPNNATDKSVTWSTSHSSRATVSSLGLVTAKAEGTVTITCKANDGSGVSASCSITIEDPTSGIEINANNFPDANFRNWLLEQDFGKDGRLTKAEISNIYTIDVNNKNINNLKGIEIFTNLAWLRCKYNQIKSLDISKNLSLTSLSCDDNQLTSLDVSKNTRLRDLSCSNNQLTNLDVSKNTLLESLLCSDNLLVTLNVSNNPKLDNLRCHNNKLSTIDVSSTDLDILGCSRNQIKETGLDALIESLPSKGSRASGYYLDIFDNTKGDEGNICTKEQVASLKNKGWTPRYYHKGITIQLWKEYEGSDEDPSDINTILMDKNTDNPIYNLSGQRQNAPQKGINIIGGKKYVVK